MLIIICLKQQMQPIAWFKWYVYDFKMKSIYLHHRKLPYNWTTLYLVYLQKQCHSQQELLLVNVILFILQYKLKSLGKNAWDLYIYLDGFIPLGFMWS